ncbi:M48 family metalloprotease [Sphingosinicella sp. BN140058]|uniref:M48 family metalloprotease n=1 Tax=Sphingosinicella sp. BN140058 TaxID=1892855 RepID=UPI0010130C44|nr:M48 family metalloprotease [Sphingosinicella sp. BN140058]QAY78540.1 peptidase M48 [Sphingosinicella sp. BN140058]
MMSSRLRGGFFLFLTTLILPAAFVALGLWQQQRAPEHHAEIVAQHQDVARVLADLEASGAGEVRSSIADMPQLRTNGMVYVGPAALSVAEAELKRLDRALLVSSVRNHLPTAVVLCAAIVLTISLVTLLGANLLGRAGRRSRDALERGFDLVRRILPILLGMQVVLTALGIVAAVAFEAEPLLELDNPNGREFKMMAIAVIVMGLSLWTAGKAVFNLRATLALFQPDPLEIDGRSLSRAQAPGLWQWVEGLADRLGALRPDQIVVGLTGGFFVTSGPKYLSPGGETFEGRTLYLPLPYLPLLRQDEAEAIVGHELGHFTGGDTEYSLRFLPIYAGVNRSLAAMVLAGRGADGSEGVITRPAVELGLFVMNRFDRAVMHWSRLREFAADEAGARITSAEAAARALLRYDAVMGRVGEVLGSAFREPHTAPDDLVAAAFAHARQRGLDNPAEEQEERDAHPTDTHPPRHQRLAALGIAPAPALLQDVMAAPADDALGRVSALFADPDGLFRELSADLVGGARAAHRAYRDELQAAAGAIGEETIVVRDSGAAGGWILMPVGLVFAAMAIGVKASDAFPEGADLFAGIIAIFALLFIAAGLWLVRRGARPFVTLSPDAIILDGIDRPLAWNEIEQVGYHVVGPPAKTRGLRFSVFLKPDAAFPRRARGRRARFKAKQRKIEIRSMRFRDVTAQDFAELIHRYRVADDARAVLEREGRALSAALGEG